MNSSNSKQIQEFMNIAIQAAQAGGKILLKHWGTSLDIHEKKFTGDLVTQADKESENEVISVIKTHFPNHHILAEESGANQATDSEFLWAIDPLDGTTNYAHGVPIVAVSIALLLNGHPIVGVVYNPIQNEFFQAGKGLGATLNGRNVKVSKTLKLQQSLLVSGFAYDRRETTDTNYPEFCHLTHLTQGVRRLGAASLDLAYVACGRMDGYWERGLKIWDMAAGILLVEEAGGTVSAYDGKELSTESGRVLATNGLIHNELSEELLRKGFRSQEPEVR